MTSDERMSGDELRTLGSAIFGNAWGWQSALARVLDIRARRVRAWLAEEDAIPAGVATQIRMLHAATVRAGQILSTGVDGPIASGPEWVIGTVPGNGDASQYLVHLHSPRFYARIAQRDTPPDLASFGREIHIDGECALEVTWLDRRPASSEARAVISRGFTQLV